MLLDRRPFIDRLRWARTYPPYREAPAAYALRVLRYTLAEQLASPDRFAFTSCGGSLFDSPRNNWSSFIAGVFGQRDLNVFRFWQRALKAGAVFLDVGANIGLYTVPACRMVGPSGRVVGFEAHPGTFAFLARNVARNCNGIVTAENLAVGSGPGEIRIAFCDRNPGETHVAAAGETGECVAMVSLDEYCERHAIPRIDYLKIDVEGYESEVLRGAERMIAASPDILIQTEYEPRHLRRYGDPHAMPALLAGWGFVPHRLAWEDGSPSPIAALDGYGGEIVWSRRALDDQPIRRNNPG